MNPPRTTPDALPWCHNCGLRHHPLQQCYTTDAEPLPLTVTPSPSTLSVTDLIAGLVIAAFLGMFVGVELVSYFVR